MKLEYRTLALLVVAAALVSCAGLRSVSAQQTGSESYGSLPSVEVTVSEPSWKSGTTVTPGIAEFEQFTDLAGLASATDVVVLARAIETGRQTTAPPKDASGFYTEITFDLEAVLSQRDGPVPSARFVVNQQAGLRPDGVTVRVEGCPLYSIGTRYVLFMRWWKDSGIYSDKGGEQGVYSVGDGNILHSVVENSRDQTSLESSLEGLSVDELAEKLRAF